MTALRQTMKHLAEVFGRRDRLYLPSAAARTNQLFKAVDDVQDGVRKDVSEKQLARELAYVVARTFSCVDAYGDIPFVEALAAKYPFTKCTYCHKRPCVCTERRERHVLASPNAIQCRWSIKQWCDSFQATYGEKNAERGAYYCLTRLFGEIAELTTAQTSYTSSGISADEYEQEIALELADVFAWTIAVANVLGIDLGAAVEKRYGKGCDVCKKKVCVCTHYHFGRMAWRVAKKKEKKT